MTSWTAAAAPATPPSSLHATSMAAPVVRRRGSQPNTAAAAHEAGDAGADINIKRFMEEKSMSLDNMIGSCPELFGMAENSDWQHTYRTIRVVTNTFKK